MRSRWLLNKIPLSRDLTADVFDGFANVATCFASGLLELIGLPRSSSSVVIFLRGTSKLSRLRWPFFWLQDLYLP
jgi:hypothetical protein